MPETGYSQAAKVNRGALVQLVPDILGVVPNIVTFQYNPGKDHARARAVEPLRGRPDKARRAGTDRAAL